MDPLVSSALITTGGNMLGGLLGGKEKRPRYRDALQAQIYATQNDFNTRMEMAKKHGLHPSLALGVQPTQSPEGFVAGTDNRVDNIFSSLGQGVSRALEANASKEERIVARTAAGLELENKKLQNERLTAEIALMRHSRTPGMAADPNTLHFPGQGDVVRVPTELIGARGPLQAGRPSDYQIYNTDHGPVRMPSEQMKQAMEDNFILETEWYARNRALPEFNKRVRKGARGFMEMYRRMLPLPLYKSR